MSDSPYFSVIIPAYNAEKYLECTLKSVYQQTFSDFEIVVVNDGSRDRTAEILNAQTDPRLRVFHQENHGVSAARNRAIRESKGKYIAFLDSDDAWIQNHLELARYFFEKYPEYVWYVTFSKHVTEILEQDTMNARENEGSFVAVNWFLEVPQYALPSGYIIRRDVMRQDNFYPEGIKIYEDALAYSTLAHQYPMVGAYTGVTVLYRRWADSAYSRFVSEGFDSLYTEKVFLAYMENAQSAKCSPIARLYYKWVAIEDWMLRIRCRSFFPWRTAMQQQEKLLGRNMVSLLVFFAWISKITCGGMAKALRLRSQILRRKMDKEARKIRINLE